MSKYFYDVQTQRVHIRNTVVTAISVLLIVAFLVSAIRTVDSGHRGVVLTLGRVEDIILQEGGPYFVIPFGYQNVVQVNVQIQKEETTTTAASADLQDVTTQVTVNFRVDPGRANVVYQTLRLDYTDRVVRPGIQEAVKAATAGFTAEELITKRPSVKTAIEDILRAALAENNILLDRVSITEFSFSQQFTNAIESKVQAEQDALRAENELLRIEIEAKQTVVRAQAEAEALVLVAGAQAEALRLQRVEVSPLLNQFKAIEKWDGRLPVFVGQEGVPLIEISALIPEDIPAP
ncbi:MAG: prohibitin family protein [Thaumarchaeota archaeon]|nr:prohibitin family protein [Nitrososphaerota archaeon]